MDLRAAWETHADEFIAWVREPGHDSYWRYHRDLFFELVPNAGRRTLDVGCGEGRLSRDLKAAGHAVVGIDASRTMIAAASQADPQFHGSVADAADLPFGKGTFDCVVASMSLQDVDDVRAAIDETARVLETGGRLCIAIVHPLNSAGEFEGLDADSPFVITESYLDQSYYEDDLARNGLEIKFVSAHRPLQAYTDALSGAGLLIDRLREPAVPTPAVREDRDRRWQRVPLFLHLRAVKP
jgi:SAM-dependent methyltransferase